MNVEFLTSLFKPGDYRSFGAPEYAFAGRSNAGKSTLINTTFNCRAAYTGKTPGKTQSINFFIVNRRFVLADLPGYGYAKVSKETQHSWKGLIEGYIKRASDLQLVFILADIRHGIRAEEQQLIDWLQFIGKPFQVVLTKIDKLTRNELSCARKQFAHLAPIFFSGLSGDGRKEILRIVEGRRAS